MRRSREYKLLMTIFSVGGDFQFPYLDIEKAFVANNIFNDMSVLAKMYSYHGRIEYRDRFFDLFKVKDKII